MTPSLHRTMPVAAPDTWRVILLFLAALASILLAAVTSGCSDEQETDFNVGPTAKAGTDQTVSEAATVTLDGSASVDIDGSVAGYAWLQLLGTPVTLSDYGAAKPTFTAPAITSGTESLVFRLTVTDNTGATSSDTVAVTVQNVSAGAGQAKYVIDSIGESARAAKSMAYGVVSTVQFCHATPAVFIAHNVSRNNYTAIATECINTTRPDVVIGAGHPGWTGGAPPAYTYITSTDYSGLVAGSAAPYNEYRLVQRVATQNGTTNLNAAVTDILNPAHASYNKKLFGLFGGTDNYMEHPVPSDAPGAPAFTWTTDENPTLADCATAALKVLNLRGGSNGFFLMVEGGDIDWANHASDYAYMIGAMYQFDRAVKAVVDYIDDSATPQTWSNTLVIVTADHANSYLRFTPGVWLGKGDLPTQTVTTPPTYPGGEVYYGVNDSHTNEPVMVYARGIGTTLFEEYEGAWYPGTRMLDNTHVYQVMRRALGLP